MSFEQRSPGRAERMTPYPIPKEGGPGAWVRGPVRVAWGWGKSWGRGVAMEVAAFLIFAGLILWATGHLVLR